MGLLKRLSCEREERVAGAMANGMLNWPPPPGSERVADSWPEGSVVNDRVATERGLAGDDIRVEEDEEAVTMEGGAAEDEDAERGLAVDEEVVVTEGGLAGDDLPVATEGGLSRDDLPVATKGGLAGDDLPVATEGGLAGDNLSADDLPVATEGGLSRDDLPVATVATEGDNFPVATEGDDFPVATEGDDFPVATEGDDFPVATEGDDFPVATEGDDFPVMTEGGLARDDLPGGLARDDLPVVTEGDDLPGATEGGLAGDELPMATEGGVAGDGLPVVGRGDRVIIEGCLAEGEEMMVATRGALSRLVELVGIEEKMTVGRGWPKEVEDGVVFGAGSVEVAEDTCLGWPDGGGEEEVEGAMDLTGGTKLDWSRRGAEGGWLTEPVSAAQPVCISDNMPSLRKTSYPKALSASECAVVSIPSAAGSNFAFFGEARHLVGDILLFLHFRGVF